MLSGLMAAAVICSALSLPADNAKKEKQKAAETESGVSWEVNAEYTYTAGSQTRRAGRDLGHTTEHYGSAECVASMHLTEGMILRTGVAMERFAYGLPDGAVPLPDSLQSVDAVIGMDLDLTEEWIMRVEARPGVYSDFTDLSEDDFNMPLVIGGSWLVNKDLQWFVGLSVNLRSEYPVMGGAGVRWKYADRWTLNFQMPKPRLEYKVNENLTAYLGGEIKTGTFKVADRFGYQHGMPRLNRASMDLYEVFAGPGVLWEVRPGVELRAGGGAMVYREYNYHSEDIILRGKPAPYGQLSFRASF
jgi:hypothetical protein